MARAINIRTSNTINRTPAITALLAEIRKYPVLTAEEEKELFVRIKSGDEAARQELINANMRFIFSLASKFAQGDNISDLFSEASIGAIEAIDSYDENRGIRFLSYSVHYMWMRISEHYRKNGSIVRKKDDARIGAKAGIASDKFYAENGRFPSEDELIDILNRDYNLALKERTDVVSIKTCSLNATIGEDGDTLEDVGEVAMATATTNEFVAVEEAEEKSHLVNCFLSQLPIREREIVKMSFGLNEDGIEYDNEAIAAKFGLTAERVRQIVATAIKGMRSRAKYVVAHA